MLEMEEVLNLLMSELYKFPKGHVAHSLMGLEIIPFNNDSASIRGISSNDDKTNMTSWYFVISNVAEWKENPILVKKAAVEICTIVQDHWIKINKMWKGGPLK